MIQAILGKKVTQGQKYLENGTRVPVTTIITSDNMVVASNEQTFTLGFDTKKKMSKQRQGILKKAGIEKSLRFFRTFKNDDGESVPAGAVVATSDVLKAGDLITVMGISKGKGFAGGVKLHHFKGGPKTHGQSDRQRAPGSIGQTTTPGRVYKGKRMAANMGNKRVTIKNLEVLNVASDMLMVKGVVPGGRNSFLVITKTGAVKSFVPLYTEKTDEVVVEEIKEEAKSDLVKAEEIKEEVTTEEVANAS